MFRLQWLALACVLTFTGCTVNGHHTYIGGKCVSCWRNPVTMEQVDSTVAGSNLHPRLEWNELIVEQVRQYGMQDEQLVYEDYLLSEIGSRARNLRQNEFAYPRAVSEAGEHLQQQLVTNRLESSYQFTAPSQIEEYDFDKQEFPVRLIDHLEVHGPSNVQVLPRNIQVNFTNARELPNFQLSPTEAEAFLAARNASRGIYVRYVLEDVTAVLPGSFNARVREIQFIDVKPSTLVSHRKEELPPLKSLTL